VLVRVQVLGPVLVQVLAQVPVRELGLGLEQVLVREQVSL